MNPPRPKSDAASRPRHRVASLGISRYFSFVWNKRKEIGFMSRRRRRDVFSAASVFLLNLYEHWSNMMRYSHFHTLAFLIVLAFPREGQGQDSARIVILSPRVGAVIDQPARERYHLFSQFGNFHDALFYVTSDSLCYARITLGEGADASDTTIHYSSQAIKMLADKIEHFKEISSGAYTIGADPPRLSYDGMTRASHKRDTALIAAQRKIMAENAWKKNHPDNAAGGGESLAWKPGDAYPFERNAALTPRSAYAHMGFGIGFAYYSPDLSSLDADLQAVEEKYSITSHPLSRPEDLCTIRLAIDAHPYEFGFDAVTNFRSDVTLLGFVIYGMYSLYQINADQLAAGVGLSYVSVNANVDYGVNLYENYYLDQVVVKGGSFGGILKGAYTHCFTPGFHFQLAADYRLQADLLSGRKGFSGFSAGVIFMFFIN